MKTIAAVKFYGGKQAVADVLGIRQPSVQNWPEYPPREQQMRLHRASHGKLKAEPEVIEFYRELTRGII